MKHKDANLQNNEYWDSCNKKGHIYLFNTKSLEKIPKDTEGNAGKIEWNISKSFLALLKTHINNIFA